jgi:hypothetical protein
MISYLISYNWAVLLQDQGNRGTPGLGHGLARASGRPGLAALARRPRELAVPARWPEELTGRLPMSATVVGRAPVSTIDAGRAFVRCDNERDGRRENAKGTGGS